MYIKKSEIEETDYRELDIPRPVKGFYYVTRLLERGKTLRVVDGDRKGNDILVRLDPKTELTLISYDTKEDIPNMFKKRWEVFEVSINYLLTYDVYENSLFYEPKTKFKIHDEVEYLRADTKQRDIAYVSHIYQHLSSDEYLLELTGDDYLYSEDEFKK